MGKQQKITVCTILGLGVSGSVCSIVRLAYVDVIGVRLQDLLVSAPDYGITSIVELGLGITAACLATLRPLFAFWFDKARTNFSSSRSRTPRSTPMALSGSKGVSGSYVTSGHNMGPKDDGFVTVTKELQISTNRHSVSGEGLELQAMSPTSPRQPRSAHRSRSRSSEESLLEVV